MVIVLLLYTVWFMMVTVISSVSDSAVAPFFPWVELQRWVFLFCVQLR